jgi:hypothetical protein
MGLAGAFFSGGSAEKMGHVKISATNNKRFFFMFNTICE